MTSLTEATIIHHVIIVMLVLWMLNSYNWCHPVAYFLSLIYLYMVHERYEMRLRRKLQYEEKRTANQRRILSDSETVRWLNHAIEKIWPICMEEIVSQKILLPIIPWFLEKYKPWTVKEALVQHLYLGRSPPVFTDMRVLRECSDNDHLVLELGMSFQTADDMSSLLAVKLTKRLGLGMWTKLHLVGMHVEGKVLVGVKFIRQWPYIGRLRICFAEPPYFQMMVKPLFSHGVDVTELPGIAGWLDKLLGVAFEQTLVEPNMLVVDVEKFASPQSESWFSVDVKEPIAHAIVEVLEADEMKPSDLNGLADPYVKGQLGPYRFRTKVQKKTLAPKWHEEFKVPICTWESPVLKIEVRDKDHLVDDKLGDCSINICDLRDGQRHDMWLPLKNIKIGKLHLAITVVEAKINGKEAEDTSDEQAMEKSKDRNSFPDETTGKDSFPAGTTRRSQRVLDRYEPIDIEGQRETGIWVHHPGSEVAQIWEPRKGKSRVGSQIQGESGDTVDSVKSTGSGSCQNDGSSSTDESLDVNDKAHSRNPIRRGLHKIGSVFQRSSRGENSSTILEEPIPSPHANIRSVKDIGVKLVVEDPVSAPSSAKSSKADGKDSSEGSGAESPNKGSVKDVAKSILKQAGKSAHGLKHAVGRKLSRKYKAESGSLPTEKDISLDSDSSGEESLLSSVDTPPDEGGSVVSTSLPGSGNDSFMSNDSVRQTTLNVDVLHAVEQISKGENAHSRDEPECTDGVLGRSSVTMPPGENSTVA